MSLVVGLRKCSLSGFWCTDAPESRKLSMDANLRRSVRQQVYCRQFLRATEAEHAEQNYMLQESRDNIFLGGEDGNRI